MRFLYSTLLTLAFIALLPYFAYQAIFNRKYLTNFKERLGIYSGGSAGEAGFEIGDRPAIWLHAVSVGEVMAAQPLVRALRARFPRHRLIVSTTTMTGQAVARSGMAGADGFCYFPFDWGFSVRRALRRIRPEAVILMESELWLNFLSECRAARIPVMIANGRISDRSFKRSKKFVFFMRRLFGLVTLMLMQSRVDAERAEALGAASERVEVGGNLKYDIGGAGEPERMEMIAEELREKLSLDSTPLIVAGSTTAGEEQLILDAYSSLAKDGGPSPARLLIAPRHPERFDEVSRLIGQNGFRFSRRALIRDTGADQPVIQPVIPPVILLDTIGELAAVYRFATIVFVGGSLVPKGGHNILEPALFGKPIVVGPHMENFREIALEFERRKALIRLQPGTPGEMTAALAETWSGLLRNPSMACETGAAARRAIEENRGATARTVDAIARLIG